MADSKTFKSVIGAATVGFDVPDDAVEYIDELAYRIDKQHVEEVKALKVEVAQLRERNAELEVERETAYIEGRRYERAELEAQPTDEDVDTDFVRLKGFIESEDDGTLTFDMLHNCLLNLRRAALRRQPTTIDYESIANFLWALLDDIDTASDMFKADYEGLAKYVYSKQQRRWETGVTSDGQSLDWTKAKAPTTEGLSCTKGMEYRQPTIDPSELREKLAAIEHERWADWQRYLHAKCVENEDGSLTIEEVDVSHWERQINTPYEDLSEEEKDSDREQVDRYWHLIQPTTIDREAI